MTSFYQNKQTCICSNCGESGHTFRLCQDPVSSYGVLIFRWTSSNQEWPLCQEFSNNTIGTEILTPQILMIQRKDSLGFMDIMRGKYKVNEPDYIKKQIRGMTLTERTKLETMEFEEIWHQLWGSDTESSQRYAHDRVVSRQKLAELRAGIELPSGEKYTLTDLLRQESVVFTTPEWGFPKGRRDPFETDIRCAYRELAEETSITEDEISKLTNVCPLIEQFYGSNGVHYRHTYYVAQYIGQRNISFDALNSEMAREIGNLAWVSVEDALTLVRPENIEKRGIITRLDKLLKSYTPITQVDLVGVKIRTNENTEEEQQGKYVFIRRAINSNSIRNEKPTRFFGARQTTRRISDLRGPEQHGIQFSRTRGNPVSRHHG